MKAILIQTTCSNQEEAKKIARVLIEEKLAACVQLNKIESIYSWKNKICESQEILLNIKTKKKLFGEIKSTILKLHSYDVPEIIEIDISNMSKNYIKFIKDNTK